MDKRCAVAYLSARAAMAKGDDDDEGEHDVAGEDGAGRTETR